jgi:vacuolar-type H+-ATPase subunit D/Vma8
MALEDKELLLIMTICDLLGKQVQSRNMVEVAYRRAQLTLEEAAAASGLEGLD